MYDPLTSMQELPCQIMQLVQVTVDRHPADQAGTAHGAGGQGSGLGSLPPAAAPLDLGVLGGLVSLLGDNRGPYSPGSNPSTSSSTSSGGAGAGSQRGRTDGAAVNATAVGLEATGQVLQERSPAIMQARDVQRMTLPSCADGKSAQLTALPNLHGPAFLLFACMLDVWNLLVRQ